VRCELQFLRRATEPLLNALRFVRCMVELLRPAIHSSRYRVQIQRSNRTSR